MPVRPDGRQVAEKAMAVGLQERLGYGSRARGRQEVVLVWGLSLRLFHWSLAALVATALATAFLAPEWWLPAHVWAGYGVAGLLVFRLGPGLFGPPVARLSALMLRPRDSLLHLRALLGGRPPRHVGHNPPGSWMIVLLLGGLAVAVISGLVVLGGQERQGPLAPFLSFALGHRALPVHRLAAWALLVLISGHVVGVIVESHALGENLVAAMLSGRKPRQVRDEVLRLPEQGTVWRKSQGRAATFAGMVMVAALLAVGARLAQLPPRGWKPLVLPKDYVEECGACHTAYHPSLLPAESWRRIMAGLDDHFGEDASLDPETTRALAAFLDTQSRWPWDTEASNGLRRVDPAHPLRITASPYWRRRHAGIGETEFRNPLVGGRANCSACHRDADTGRFDDAAISPPRGGG